MNNYRKIWKRFLQILCVNTSDPCFHTDKSIFSCTMGIYLVDDKCGLHTKQHSWGERILLRIKGVWRLRRYWFT